MPVGPALLFCPADRPDRFLKAAAAADMVILDLEDGVRPADRAGAREALATTLLDPQRTLVRVNPVGTEDFSLDMVALARTPYENVMLAKTESAQDVDALGPRPVIALCETARGVVEVANIAQAASTVALMWGAEDLVVSLGGRSSRTSNGHYRAVATHARSQVLLAARAHDRAAIDSVHLDIADLEGLRSEALDAAGSGFCATACIHPTQVAIVRAAYEPTDEEIAWASAVIKAAEGQRGVFTFQGRMIDAPLLGHALQILHALSRQPPS